MPDYPDPGVLAAEQWVAGEQAVVLALVQASSGDLYQTAGVIAEAGSAVSLLAGNMPVMSDERRRSAGGLLSRVSAADGAGKAELTSG